ncbi:DUF2232 domain-containing protein [Paenibacillus antri]|uniref:DUF2232 domain-containing protein n=1 Tax=Paenibacillus antri TaxID=2582848 RepID=A0A5R9FXX2_9BACL|nr:DUF2232 domain-containing protein [Paenibacillus antri]TLS48887.1 DUF2232 domain-containing protein [Paenibacillus antri]
MRLSAEQASLKKHALVWGIVLFLVHLSLLTPLLIITVWFAAVPAVLLYVKSNRAWFAGVSAVSLIVGAALSGSLAIAYLGIALTTLVPGIALGEAYRRRWTARKSITAGVVAYLAVYLLTILIATMMGVNLTTTIADTIRDGMAYFPENVSSIITDETLHEFIQLSVMMIPFYLIATSTFLTVLTHTIARRIANRTRGASIPQLPPIRDWKLPRSFVWYYLIALFAELFVPVDPGSFLSTIVVNIVPILMLAFVVQGVSFLFFIGHAKRKMWIPWLGVVAVVLFNPLFMPFSLLGVFDTAFPLRDRFRKS